VRAPECGANIIFIEKRKSFPASQKSLRFLVSRSDPQCFSHEDGCFAPLANCENSLSELLHHNPAKMRFGSEHLCFSDSL